MQCQCCFQNNFPVASKLLKELHREAKTNRGWLLQWVHSFSRFSHKHSQTQGPVDQISAMLKTIPLLSKLRKENYNLIKLLIFFFQEMSSKPAHGSRHLVSLYR